MTEDAAFWKAEAERWKSEAETFKAAYELTMKHFRWLSDWRGCPVTDEMSDDRLHELFKWLNANSAAVPEHLKRVPFGRLVQWLDRHVPQEHGHD
jgi:hypothetical protein